MTSTPAVTRALRLALFALPLATHAAGQPLVSDETIRARWLTTIGAVAGPQGVTVQANGFQGTDEQKRDAYREAIGRLLQEPVRSTVDPAIIQQTVRAQDRRWIEALRASGTESRVPKEVDSRSTNPVTRGLTERSGLTDLVALALNGQNVVSSDATAISLNLNALALVSLADPDVYSELYRYQQHAFARRFGGTVTLGSKIPEKELTGVSSLPDFDTLVDAVGWDVKVRLIGDKDPRSAEWYPLTIGRGADLNSIAAVVSSLVPIGDALLVSGLFQDALSHWLTDLKQRIARSAQLTGKISGTHLRNDSGKNKYTAALLFDVGVGATDVTANGTYAVTNDVSLGVDRLFAVKRFDFSAQVTSHLAGGAFATGRTADWSLGSTGTFFVDKASVPVPLQNTWKIFSTFDVPVGKAAKIPFSIIYSNDPNALEKSKYLSGFVGISYDFAAIGQLFGQTN